MLVLMGEGDAVPRVHLSGQLELEDVAAVRTASFDRGVGRVVPMRGIAGKAVCEEAFGEGRTSEVAAAAEEPQAIDLERPAERAAHVVLIDQCRRPGQTD